MILAFVFFFWCFLPFFCRQGIEFDIVWWNSEAMPIFFPRLNSRPYEGEESFLGFIIPGHKASFLRVLGDTKSKSGNFWFTSTWVS